MFHAECFRATIVNTDVFFVVDDDYYNAVLIEGKKLIKFIATGR